MQTSNNLLRRVLGTASYGNVVLSCGVGNHVRTRGLPGGAEGNRTPDLCSAIAALSHLSYSPDYGCGAVYVWRVLGVNAEGRQGPDLLLGPGPGKPVGFDPQ